MIGSNVLFQRKGFILDAWSGPLQSSEVLVALVAEAARDSSGGVDMVVELTGSDETLTQRWLVANGQDAKANVTKLPKDLQASYKIFEIALSQYKGKICDVEVSTTNSNSEDQEKIRSHEEINKMRENGVSVLRFDFLDSVVESVCSSIQEACVADTTSFGWLRASPSSLASAESSTPGVNTDLEPLAKEAVSVDVNDNSEVFTEQDIDYVRQKSKEYEDYSLATVLPTLAKVFVSIARDKPTDPLLFAIDSLSEIANRMEEVEENEARASFEAVLAASRAS
jgi:hypothetical protein